MGKILTIARLMIRTGIHSRTFVALLFLVLITVIGLPLTIKGDGTPAGQTRIVIEYTLGTVSALLAVTVAWMACGAVSLELSNHQLQLVLTRPVHRFQIWIGKWLGIVAMAGTLLLIAGLIVYWMLARINSINQSAQFETPGQKAIAVTRQSITPQPTDIEAQVQEQIRTLRSAGTVAKSITDAQLAYQVRANMRHDAATMPPGRSHTWLFKIPYRPGPDQKLFLEFRFASSRPERQPVSTGWRVGSTPEKVVTTLPETVAGIALPASAVPLDLVVPVIMTNRQLDPPTAIVFEDEGDLKLVLQSPGLIVNFIQSLLLIFGNLALLAALGLTAGCLFSMPTASFIAIFVLLVMNMGGYITDMVQSGIVAQGHAGPAIGLNEYPLAVRSVFHALAAILQPLQEFSPVHHLAESEKIGWSMTLRGLCIHIGVYAGILGAIGTWLFNRRETALPGR